MGGSGIAHRRDCFARPRLKARRISSSRVSKNPVTSNPQGFFPRLSGWNVSHVEREVSPGASLAGKMTWYEKARRFTFPKNSTTSGTDPANGGPNKADALLEKPPLRANTAPRGQPSLEQEAVSNYNLDWRELRPFLMKKYPDLKFEENQVLDNAYTKSRYWGRTQSNDYAQYGCQDHFVFDVPENHRLTDVSSTNSNARLSLLRLSNRKIARRSMK